MKRRRLMGLIVPLLLAADVLGNEPPRTTPNVIRDGLNQLVQANPIPETDVQKQLLRKRLPREIVGKFDGHSIVIRSTVTNVQWSKGIARVYTTVDEGLPEEQPVTEIRIRRGKPFSLRVTEERAAAINVGDKLEFTAILKFHPYQLASATFKDAETLYAVYYLALNPSPLGTFSGEHVRVTIAGHEYPTPSSE